MVRSCGKAAGNWVLCLSAQGTENRSLPIRIISAHLLPPPRPPPPPPPPPLSFIPLWLKLQVMSRIIHAALHILIHHNPYNMCGYLSYTAYFPTVRHQDFSYTVVKHISTVQHIQCNKHFIRTCLVAYMCLYVSTRVFRLEVILYFL
jgi:hypothetical protein